MVVSPVRQPKPRLAREARKEQLLDIAEDLFVRLGYAATSIEDVARSADISRPIVYEHFGTKEGIYLACVRRARNSYEQLLVAAFAPAAATRVQLAAAADAFFRLLEENPKRWQLLFGSNAVLPGEYQQELAELRFGTIDQIAAVLRPSLPTLSETQLQAIAHSVSGVGERLGHWWLRRPELSRADLVAHFVDFVWSGMSPYVAPEP